MSLFLSSLSLLGALLILASYLYFPSLRKFSFTLIAMMSVADVITIFSYYLGNPQADTGLCTVQGWVQQFGELSSIGERGGARSGRFNARTDGASKASEKRVRDWGPRQTTTDDEDERPRR